MLVALIAFRCAPGRPGRRRATRRDGGGRAPGAGGRGARGAGSRRVRSPKARRALALTAEFVPTEYVDAGRKGEVVEDEFKAARDEYKRHRATLYEAVGSVLARQGQPLPASRYQRRAFELEPTPARGLALARSLNDLGRGREALYTVQRAIAGLTRPAARGGGGDRPGGRRRRAAERAGRDRPRPARRRSSAPRSSCGRDRSSCRPASASRRTPCSASTRPRST